MTEICISYYIGFRRDNKVVTSTTFLVGAEALDEVVGNLKVQLAPKTNFWSNAAGAANVAKAVADMLKPTQKVTIVEVGCGIGVIGLMMASVSTRVIHTACVRKQNALSNEQNGTTDVLA